MAKAAKATPAKPFDINDILATASAPAEKPSKSKAPVIMAPKELQELAKRVRDAKEELDSLTSLYETAAAELVQKVAPFHEGLCKAGYISTVRVPTSDGLSVSLSWSKSYTKAGVENVPALKEIVGEDLFPAYFKSEMEITVKDVSEESLRELIEAVGPERFARFFEVARWVKPTERYTADFYAALSTEQRQRLGVIVRQYKPSVKTK